LTLEEMAEEALLQLFAIAAVEVGEVGVAMHFQPFLRGAGAQVAFEIPAGVQALAAPIGGGQQRNLDIFPARNARAIIRVDRSARQRFVRDIGAVARKLRLRQRLCAGNGFAGDHAARPARADSELDTADLTARPRAQEVAKYAAVPTEL